VLRLIRFREDALRKDVLSRRRGISVIRHRMVLAADNRGELSGDGVYAGNDTLSAKPLQAWQATCATGLTPGPSYNIGCWPGARLELDHSGGRCHSSYRGTEDPDLARAGDELHGLPSFAILGRWAQPVANCVAMRWLKHPVSQTCPASNAGSILGSGEATPRFFL
jgi:hypothetical protein